MESGRERKRGMEENPTWSSSLLASATEDEIIVAQILLDLKSMISLSESLSNSNWGRRRKRSSLEVPPPLPRAPSPENRIEEKINVAPEEKLARSSESPDTPLSFSPIVHDGMPKHSLKKSSKKRARQREELLDMVEALTRRKELLTRELEKVKKYYDELKAHNSHLRAKKQDALNSKLAQHHQMNPPSPADRDFDSQPSDNGVGSVGPRGFDLNLPAEETVSVEVYQPLDVMRAMADRRARFAEARRNRIGILKTKSNKRTMV